MRRLPTVTRAVGGVPAPRSSEGSIEKRLRPNSRSASRSRPTDSESRPAARVAAPVRREQPLLLAGLRLREVRDLALVLAREESQDLQRRERRVGAERRRDALERAAHAQRDAVRADPRLGLDVEQRVEPLRVDEVERAALDVVGAALEVETPALDLGAARDARARASFPAAPCRRARRASRGCCRCATCRARACGGRAGPPPRARWPRGGARARRSAEQLRGDVVASGVERLAYVDRRPSPTAAGRRRTGAAARRSGCAVPSG